MQLGQDILLVYGWSWYRLVWCCLHNFYYYCFFFLFFFCYFCRCLLELCWERSCVRLSVWLFVFMVSWLLLQYCRIGLVWVGFFVLLACVWFVVVLLLFLCIVSISCVVFKKSALVGEVMDDMVSLSLRYVLLLLVVVVCLFVCLFH